jgi:hypothetical protein
LSSDRSADVFAVEQVLRRVVSAVANEGLRVDHQPRLPQRAQNIPGVEIGGQQRVVERWPLEFGEEPNTVAASGYSEAAAEDSSAQ